ncbi:hypothetical protein [Streptomyces bicolor]|uniref:hypothetical protein n=1 Tax=Streptomyces bicolor TaxID=66874 RepID=UPI0004E20962
MPWLRTLGEPQRARKALLHHRLVRDYEHLPRSSESRVYWAMTAVILRRLTAATAAAWRGAWPAGR